MKVLVTGGAGFIGAHLVEELLKLDVETSIFDNLISSNNQCISSVANTKNAQLVKSDIRDLDRLLSAVSGVDIIFHLAALTNIPESIKDPISFYDVNVKGTLNVLYAALKANVPRVIIASSCSVYGDIYESPLKESYLPNPKSPYAASKLMAEALAESFYYSYGLETICLRYFNVYGLRQRVDSDYAAVIPKFIQWYKQKQHPQVYGDGMQSRDFIHVKDVVRANILAATLPSSVLRNNRIFNIGTGRNTHISALLNIISNEAGYYMPPKFQEPRLGEVLVSYADTTLTKKHLKFHSTIDLELGIKNLYLT